MSEHVTEPVRPKHLTVAYITNRREPHFEWFADSFHRECGGDYSNIKIVVIDFWCQYDDERIAKYFMPRAHCPLVVNPPHPNVWQGKYRLTAEDYFAASCARNTAICLAPDGYIAFVDDISVLMPGWLGQVREAIHGGWVACGAYRKVKNLVYDQSGAISFSDHPSGWDCRWRGGIPSEPQACSAGDVFGCSLAGPIETFLDVNGFDEDCDSEAHEDYVMGFMLAYNNWPLRYCRRMLTYESEELHHQSYNGEKPLRRIIKKHVPGVSHFSEKDASHAMLGLLSGGRRTAPNYFPGGIRAERERVLRGEPFTIIQCPEHDWRDGQPIRGMCRENDGCP